MILRRTLYFILFLITISEVVYAGVPPLRCGKRDILEISAFTKSTLFAYFQREHGKRFKCTYSESDKAKSKVLKLESKNRLIIEIQDITTPEQRFSWVSFLFLDKQADISAVYYEMTVHFRYMGLTLDWRNFHSFADGNEQVLVYCDSLYRTGVLGVARYREGILSQIEYGVLERNVCPQTSFELKKIFNNK